MMCSSSVRRLAVIAAGAACIFVGCESPVRRPVPVCPPAESAETVISSLQAQYLAGRDFIAYGRAVYIYRNQAGKLKKESFPLKLWVQPPRKLRMHGDIAFNARGIDLGSNGEELWLAIRPKEVSKYVWGKWSQIESPQSVALHPQVMLDAFGLAEIGNCERYTLSYAGAFNVLTYNDEHHRRVKRIFVYSCSRRIAKIEYFDVAQKPALVLQLSEYTKVGEGFYVPSRIKFRKLDEESDSTGVDIRLGSVKSKTFSTKLCDRLFCRPEPSGFKNVYRIVGDELIVQRP